MERKEDRKNEEEVRKCNKRKIEKRRERMKNGMREKRKT